MMPMYTIASLSSVVKHFLQENKYRLLRKAEIPP